MNPIWEFRDFASACSACLPKGARPPVERHALHPLGQDAHDLARKRQTIAWLISMVLDRKRMENGSFLGEAIGFVP